MASAGRVRRLPGAAAAAWQGLLDALPHPAWVVALKGRRVVATNAAAGAFFGRESAALVGELADELVTSPEDLAWWNAAARGEAGRLHSDGLVTVREGRSLHVSRSIGLVHIPGDHGGAEHALVLLCDRSAEVAARDEREGLLAELQATLEATADGILVTDLDGHLHAFNRRFAEIWGMPLQLLEQNNDAAIQAWMRRSVVSPQDAATYDERLHQLLQDTQASASERLVLHSGQILERVTRPLFRSGAAQGRVWSFRDLTARVVAEERVEALALQDALTGLPNRARLAERVDELGRLARRDGHGFGLLWIGLDRFRQINDSLGHDSGDQVLLGAAERIQACLREGDMLARLGGDEFAVLVSPADAAAAEATARRVLKVVAQPCNVDGAQFTLTCSIGIALAPAQGTSIDELARHAEAAMHRAKAGGRAGWRVHEMRAEGDRRLHMKLDHAMRQALVSGRFRLHYQPQVDLASGKIVGAEALLRWRDPELGEVSPARFIPVAEETGFIIAIGDWVLSQAVRQAALWHGRGISLPIAVNVSALQFHQAHFVDRIASVLAVSGVPPRLLELELTESILLRDADEALHRLQALARLGVQMSIDDFGTGYSSLSYLKRFPIGKLKIDRSFVAGLPGDESDAGIVRAILQMARALGKRVVAEGVETEAQRRFLADAGCESFQGFLFAPALDCLSFEQRLAATDSASARPARLIRLVGP